MTETPLSSPDLGEGEFTAIRDRVYRRSGIAYAPAKKALIVSRLQRRLRELGLSSFREYVGLALADAEEETRMLEALCTHETSFFREPQHFELLRSHILPHWLEEAQAGRRPRSARVLSAGCSTGEEPYSVAMFLAASLAGWSIEVVGGDLSVRALARAARGEWPIDRADQIPMPLLKQFMRRGVGPRHGTMSAGPELRAMTRFKSINLGEPVHAGLGQFDLVFCRNVLIYFDAASKARAVRSLLPHLLPGGFFFVGHSESLMDIGGDLAVVIPTVYRSSKGSTSC